MEYEYRPNIERRKRYGISNQSNYDCLGQVERIKEGRMSKYTLHELIIGVKKKRSPRRDCCGRGAGYGNNG